MGNSKVYSWVSCQFITGPCMKICGFSTLLKSPLSIALKVLWHLSLFPEHLPCFVLGLDHEPSISWPCSLQTELLLPSYFGISHKSHPYIPRVSSEGGLWEDSLFHVLSSILAKVKNGFMTSRSSHNAPLEARQSQSSLTPPLPHPPTHTYCGPLS